MDTAPGLRHDAYAAEPVAPRARLRPDALADELRPVVDLYDSQVVDNYTNCIFDPTDDGNTEDDYFDPTDPNRRLGPSSGCNP